MENRKEISKVNLKSLIKGALGIGALLVSFGAKAQNNCAKVHSEIVALRFEALKPQEINYQLVGPKTAPTLVLIHGLGSSLETWTPVAAALKGRFRILLYDQRGHGKTPARGEDYSTATMANDLNALLEHLDISSVHLVGHSLGARTAMKFLDLHPEKVRSAVLEDMEMKSRQDDAVDKIAKHLRYGRHFAGLSDSYPSIEAAIRSLLPVFDGDVERAARYLPRIADINPQTGQVFLHNPDAKTFYGFQASVDDFGPTLRKTDRPLLFLRANPGRSVFFSDEGVQHIWAHQPNAQIEQINGAHHTIHDPETLKPFLTLVRDFVDDGKISFLNRRRFGSIGIRR